MSCPFVRPASSPAVRPDGRDASRRRAPRIVAATAFAGAVPRVPRRRAHSKPPVGRRIGYSEDYSRGRRRGGAPRGTPSWTIVRVDPRSKTIASRATSAMRAAEASRPAALPRRRPTRRPTRRQPRMKTLKAARTTGSGSSIAADVAPDGGSAGATPRRAPSEGALVPQGAHVRRRRRRTLREVRQHEGRHRGVDESRSGSNAKRGPRRGHLREDPGARLLARGVRRGAIPGVRAVRQAIVRVQGRQELRGAEDPCGCTTW